MDSYMHWGFFATWSVFSKQSINLDYNFPGRKNMEHCQCGFINITNEHLFKCDILNNNEKYSHTYQQLLNGTLSKQKILLNILNQSMKNHKKFSQAACAGS